MKVFLAYRCKKCGKEYVKPPTTYSKLLAAHSLTHWSMKELEAHGTIRDIGHKNFIFMAGDVYLISSP